MARSFDALGAPDAESVRVKVRVHPVGEHYVRVPRAVRVRETMTRARSRGYFERSRVVRCDARAVANARAMGRTRDAR